MHYSVELFFFSDVDLDSMLEKEEHPYEDLGANL